MSIPKATEDNTYYRHVYRDYRRQNPAHKLSWYKNLTISAIGKKEVVRVLDIGCAFGDFLDLLPAGWEKIGIDVNSHAIDVGRRKYSGLALHVCDAQSRLPEGSYDLITAFDSLEHMAALDEAGDYIFDALAPGGCLLFVVPVYDGITGPVIRLLDRDPTHIQMHSRTYWLEWVAPRLNIVKWWGIYRYLTPVGYLHLPTERLRRHTPAIAVICRQDRICAC